MVMTKSSSSSGTVVVEPVEPVGPSRAGVTTRHYCDGSPQLAANEPWDRLLIRPTWWAKAAGRFTAVAGQVSGKTLATGPTGQHRRGQACDGSQPQRCTDQPPCQPAPGQPPPTLTA